MLNIIEFKAKIKQGVIEIPKEYQQQLNEGNEVQVIVTKQVTNTTSQAQKAKDIIDDLTENPIKINGFLSRDEIYDHQS
jgi:predicted RecA/RadA family phage recombinase